VAPIAGLKISCLEPCSLALRSEVGEHWCTKGRGLKRASPLGCRLQDDLVTQCCQSPEWARTNVQQRLVGTRPNPAFGARSAFRQPSGPRTRFIPGGTTVRHVTCSEMSLSGVVPARFFIHWWCLTEA
jgi:hypothetical protein